MDRLMLLFAKSDVERGASVFGSGRVRGETRGSCLSPLLYAKPGLFISTARTIIRRKSASAAAAPASSAGTSRIVTETHADALSGLAFAVPKLVSFAALRRLGNVS